MACPDMELLDLHVHGGLPAALRDGVAAHVDACRPCQERLAEIRVNLRLAERLAGHLQPLTGDPSVAETITLEVGPRGVPAAKPVVVPCQLGPFSLMREIGRGGMGIVYRGWHELLQRDVAVKFLTGIIATADDPELKRFLEGARAAAQISHPNLTIIHHADLVQGVPYLVMEFVEGPSVADLLRRGLRDATLALHVLDGAAHAVAVLHERGIIHRDIKPGNILVDPTGQIKVTDFGLSCAQPALAVEHSADCVAGTPAFMAPESFEGTYSPRTDVYALGITAFQLLTGELPFQAGNVRELRQMQMECPLPEAVLAARGVSPKVMVVLQQATHKDPKFRTKSAGHFRRALAEAAGTPGEAPAARLELARLVTRATTDLPVAPPVEAAAPSSSYHEELSVWAERKRTREPQARVESTPSPEELPESDMEMPDWSRLTRDSLWHRRMRGRVRLIRASLALAALGLIAVPVVLHLISRGWRLPPEANFSLVFAALLFVPLVLMLFAVGWCYWRFNRARVILSRVPASNGFVCPACLARLSPAEKESHCPACRAPYTVARLRTYWEQYAHAPAAVEKWSPERAWQSKVLPRSGRRRTTVLVIWCIVVVAALAGFYWWQTGSSVFTTLAWILQMLPMGLFGVMLVQAQKLFVVIRGGRSRHCASCEYQQPPVGAVPERCPECGAHWKEAGGTVYGARVRAPWASVVALVLLTAWLVGELGYIVTGWRASEWTLKLAPTSALIHDVVHAEGFMNAQWKALRSRKLTPQDERGLAESAIEKWRADADGHLDLDLRKWFETSILTRTMPTDLVHRFCQETLHVGIDVPAEARVGKPFRVTPTADFRSGPLSQSLHVFVGGFRIGEAPELVGQQNEVFSRFSFHPSPVEIVPRNPGPLALTIRVWLVIDGQRPPPAVAWKEDATPEIPASAAWVEEFVATATVVVKE